MPIMYIQVYALSVFQIFKKHLHVYAFPACVDTNICPINDDIKDSEGVFKGYITEVYGAELIICIAKDVNVNDYRKPALAYSFPVFRYSST